MKKIRIFAGDYGRTKQCEGARKTGVAHRGAGETLWQAHGSERCVVLREARRDSRTAWT